MLIFKCTVDLCDTEGFLTIRHSVIADNATDAKTYLATKYNNENVVSINVNETGYEIQAGLII